MTVTWGTSYRYGDIGRTLLTSLRSFAIEPTRQRVLVASRLAGGQMGYAGESSQLAFQPRELTNDGTNIFVVGAEGVEKHTEADQPVFAALFTTDCGLGRFIFAQNSYLVCPCGRGGVQTISKAAGVQAACLPGLLSEISAAAYDGANRRLWLFDERKGLGASVLVGTAGQLTFQQTFLIPNCRQIVRVVFDSTAALLFVVNRNRIVSLSTATWQAPVLATDYGLSADTFTDFVKIGTDQYWIGTRNFRSDGALSGAFGEQFGSWDSVRSEMQIACPQVSQWNVTNVVPYSSAASIGTGTPTGSVRPAAPVITSALTSSTTEDLLWTYTITATGTGPISYGLVSPPSWVSSINSITGVIKGTPPDPATINLTITATNAGGTTSATLVLTVGPALGNVSAVRSNGAMTAYKVIGTLLYMGGNFSTVTDRNGTYTRNKVACLDLTTGLFTSFDPNCGVATPNVFATDGTYIYIGAGNGFTVNGGTVRNGAARVTLAGVLDSWNPNLPGNVNDILMDGTNFYLCGTFTTAGGSAHEFIAKYTTSSGALSTWRPTDGAGHFILGDGSGNCARMIDNGGTIIMLGGMAMLKTGGSGYWGSRILEVDKTTGAPSTAVHYLPDEVVLYDAVVMGGITYCAGQNGATNVRKVSDGTLFAGPFSPISHPTSFSGTTWQSGFNPGFLAAATDAILRIKQVDTDLVILGQFLSLNGDATAKYVKRVTAAGATVPGFVATWAGGTASGMTALETYANAIIIGGSFTGSVTINGADRDNIAFLNKDTGAVF